MDETITLTPAMLALVPTVAMILQVIKKTPIFNYVKPYYPIISCATGILVAYCSGMDNSIVAGLMIGLSASAGYSQFKEITNKEK